MQTFRLPAFERLTVTADALSAGSFWRLPDTHATVGSPTVLTAGTSGTDMILNTVTFGIGDDVSVVSWTIAQATS